MFASVVNCTRTPAALRPVEPIAGAGSRSSTVTRSPLEARCQAQDAPLIPEPMTTTSGVLKVTESGGHSLDGQTPKNQACAATT